MAIADVITELRRIEATLPGVKAAYDATPESMTVMPCFVNYPISGESKTDAATMLTEFHTIVSELHVARGVLPVAEATARPFIERFIDAVWKGLYVDRLNHSVTTVNAIRYRYVTFTAGDDVHIGIRFETDIKILRTYEV